MSKACVFGPDKARIAVVGAGLAGLTAARYLKRAGCYVTLFEGAARVGGRVKSAVDVLGPGLVTELGGEFIDSSHADVLSLAKEFSLDLIDTQLASEGGLATSFFFGGKQYSEERVIHEFSPVAERMRLDAGRLSKVISARSHSVLDAELDRLSIAEYLKSVGATGWLRDLLHVAYVTEYGMDADEQSCLNLLTLKPFDTSSGFRIFGNSDERYKIRGGNEQIIQALAADLGANIQLDHYLQSVRNHGSGYRLFFSVGSGVKSADFDFVVLAIPFTVLREVEFVPELSPDKYRAIQALGYGNSEKVIAAVRSPIWRELGFDGEAYTDRMFQTGWDSGRLQEAASTSYTFYLGGSCANSTDLSNSSNVIRIFLNDAELMYPGLKDVTTGLSIATDWHKNLFSLGGYSCYKCGQWTTIAGIESEPIGNLFFAGEHCSREFQGYMNGAAQTGRKAAETIIAKLA